MSKQAIFKTIPDSLSQSPPARGPAGQLAHADAIEHHKRLLAKLYQIENFAWCVVGNGLSNQTFVEGPEGIIAIDSGESIEEMQAAVDLLREFTQTPIIACIYTHFHYVNGTQALLGETGGHPLRVYGHADITGNLRRMSGEIAPRASRGMVHQLGLALPAEGEDALLDCGLGRFYRNPEHAPFTAGYLPADFNVTTSTTFKIAGLDCELIPAPSDATDSLTIWFPELQLCINNLIWPSLYNIYAIRGETYRDPQILLQGIDAIGDLRPSHLLCTHGPPLSGSAIQPAIIDFRDAIAFLWDQTVRAANLGLGLSEITQSVQLPGRFKRSYFTQQFYGLAEHHVRQIYNGLFGWFDEADQHLLPMPEQTRCERMIAGFGGRAKVIAQIDAALDDNEADNDVRWAIELASWLVQAASSSGNKSDQALQDDKQRLANALRQAAQTTTASNVRNWCLTRALTLEGRIDTSRFFTHRFRKSELSRHPPATFIPALRVLLDAQKSADMNMELAWLFGPNMRTGLRIRHGVAIPTTGLHADYSLTLSAETWAEILCGETNFWIAEEKGLVSISGDRSDVKKYLACLEIPSFH